jgi:hypothetical protein
LDSSSGYVYRIAGRTHGKSRTTVGGNCFACAYPRRSYWRPNKPPLTRTRIAKLESEWEEREFFNQCFVTMEDGLFVSYLLSPPLRFDGESYWNGKTATPCTIFGALVERVACAGGRRDSGSGNSGDVASREKSPRTDRAMSRSARSGE